MSSIRISRKSITKIEPLFRSWIKLNNRYNKNVDKDCTYYYGERTNCSILCAAAFDANMVASMEIPILRKKRRGEEAEGRVGRYDMYLCHDGREYIFEMKQAWTCSDADNKLSEAEAQIRSIRRTDAVNALKIALVFLAPGFSAKRFDQPVLNNFIDEVNKKQADGVVHYYPDATRGLRGGGKYSEYVYPGVSILVRVVG